jgi:4-amino-4-deoxy-L-arabinose transferase-like glycosyltransferase
MAAVLLQVPTTLRRLLIVSHPALFGLGVVAVGAVLFFTRLGERSLWAMELRWAEIPREMRLSGDYFRPTINGRLYYDKPLGSYWLVLAAGWITGSVDELSARLPSAAAGLLGVIMLIDLARRLYDGRTAALAGLILATSFAFVFFARCASADAENVAGVLAALNLYVRHHRGTNRKWVIGLWLVMALTSLTKGLLGFALPLGVLASHSVLSSGGLSGFQPSGMFERCRWLLSRTSMLGALVAAALYFAPFAASGATADRGLSLVYRENIQRFFAPHNHLGPVYLYTYVIFGLMAPWSVFLPAALLHARSAVRSGDKMAEDRFALVYFVATFLFFTLSASRRSYYLLPVLPAGALLVARVLATPAETVAPMVKFATKAGFAALSVVVVVAGAALLPHEWLPTGSWRHLPAIPFLGIVAIAWIGCVTGLMIAWRMYGRRSVRWATGTIATLAMAYLYVIALPALESYRSDRAFADEVRAIVGPGVDHFALYRTRELVYYLDFPAPIAEFESIADLCDAADSGNVRWAVARRRDLDGLRRTARVITEEPTYPWEGTNERKQKALLLDFGGTSEP